MHICNASRRIRPIGLRPVRKVLRSVDLVVAISIH